MAQRSTEFKKETKLQIALLDIETSMKTNPDMPRDERRKWTEELIRGYCKLGNFEKSEKVLEDAKELFSPRIYRLFEQRIKEEKKRSKPPKGYYI